jgi:hypothetical protein
VTLRSRWIIINFVYYGTLITQSSPGSLFHPTSSNALGAVSYAGTTHMLLQRATGLRTETRQIQRCIQRFQPSGYLSQRQLSIPSSLKKKQEPLVKNELPTEQNEKLPARKTSLRRVGLEAERSRVIVRHRGGLRVVDAEVETKVIQILPPTPMIC